MKISVKILLLPVVVCCSAVLAVQECAAQNIEEFRRRLAQSEVVGEGGATACVYVTESADAAAAVARSRTHGSNEVTFQGYRVGIYSGNDPKAQENSLTAKQKCEDEFPDINVYWVYDNPYFKVTAGDCLTEEEAVMLLARVRRHFPKAYVVRAAMTLENIILRERDEPADEPEKADAD